MNSSTAHENLSRLAWPGSRQGARERAVHWLDSAIFFGLLVLIALAAIPYGAVQPQWEAAFECGVFVLAAMWIIEGYISGAWQLTGRSLLLPLVALVAFAIVQTISWDAGAIAGIKVQRAMSLDPYETRLFAFMLVAIILFLAMLLHHASSSRRLRTLVYLVIGLGVASALFGLVRGTTHSGGPSFILPFLKPGTGYGQFINPNHFAFLMEMSLGLMLGLIAGSRLQKDRLIFYLAAVVAMWTALVLSNSRGGIVSMLAQLFFIALLFPAVRGNHDSQSRRSKWNRLQRRGSSMIVRVTLVGVLVAVVGVGVVLVGGESLMNRLEVVSDEVSSENNNLNEGVRRLEIWRATWQLIKDHPITGVGFGSYATAIPKYHNASGMAAPREAHNDYLELLASGGVIGVMLGAWFFIAFINQARARLKSKDPFRRAACFGALAGLFGIAIHSLTDFGLHVTVNALVCIALIVIAVVNGRVESHGANGRVLYELRR